MNYAEARALADGTGWHFTTMNDGVVHAAPCCRLIVPATAADVARLDWIFHGTLKVGDPILGSTHEPHRSRAAAEACYHAWVVASVGLGWVAGERDDLDPDRDSYLTWESCEAVLGWDEPQRLYNEPVAVLCDAPTRKGAHYRGLGGPNSIPLCATHYTLEIARTLVPRSTQLIYS